MSERGARILVVDDEPAILRSLRRNLSARGYAVTTAANGEEALDAFARQRPDVIVLDLGLPDLGGIEVCRAVRRQTSTPIIVLSARGNEQDKVEALDAGADDYVTKPFSLNELLARIRVALRHLAAPSSGSAPVLVVGPLRIDFDRRRVWVDDREVHLTPIEYDLLKALATNSGRVLTHRMLLQSVWGAEYGDASHYLHVHVANLRRKLEPDPSHPRLIATEPGVGYRFVEPMQGEGE